MEEMLRKFCITASLLLLTSLQLTLGVPSVSLDVPNIPVQEGEPVQIRCTVTEKANFFVFISRQGDNKNEFLVFRDHASSIFPDNIEFSSTSDGIDTFVGTLTIVAKRSDQQTYTCSVGTSPFNDDIRDSKMLIVQYQPDSEYPKCSLENSEIGLTRQAGSSVTMHCISALGNPPVGLLWGQRYEGSSDVKPLSPLTDTSSTTIIATIIRVLSRDDDGATFTCSMSSYPSRFCSIGPFEVTGSNNNSSAPSYDSGRVIAIAVLLVVLIIVIVVVVVAVLVKYGKCKCGNNKANTNKNHRLRSSVDTNDDVDTRNDIEMQTIGVNNHKKQTKYTKKGKSKKSRKSDEQILQYSIEHVPSPLLENGYAYAQDVKDEEEEHTKVANGNVSHDHFHDPEHDLRDRYPPPPEYSVSDTESEEYMDDLDDEQFVIPEKLYPSDQLEELASQDASVPSKDSMALEDINDETGETGESGFITVDVSTE